MLHASAFLKWDPKRHLCQLKAGFSVLSDSKLYNRCPKTVFVYFLLYIDYQMIAYNQKRRQKRIIFDSELWKGQIQMSSLIWAYSKAHHWIIILIRCWWLVLTTRFEGKCHASAGHPCPLFCIVHERFRRTVRPVPFSVLVVLVLGPADLG